MQREGAGGSRVTLVSACEQWELKNEKSIQGISRNSDDAGSLNYQDEFNDVEEREREKKKPKIIIM